MQTTLYDPHPGAPAAPIARRTAAALPPTVARNVLGAALLLGVASDTLLRDAPVGVAFGCWAAILAVNLTALARRADRQPSVESRIWLAAAVVFASGLAFRDADTIQALDVLATLGALGMAAVSMRDARVGVFASRLRDVIQAAVYGVASIAGGVVPLALRDVQLTTGTGTRSRIASATRTAAIVAFAILIFGALLRGADPVFASIANIPSIDFGTIGSHIFLSGLFAWLIAGWARAALLEPNTSTFDLPAPALSNRDVMAVLVALDLLFAAFVATQIASLVGGEAFVKRTAGLTFAEYARHGFFQIVVVAALVIPLLAATRAQLEPRSANARRHTWLSLPLMVLVGGMIASAVWRLTIYVRFFGLTTDRVYPLVFLGWLGLVLVWMALTTLRDWPRPFLAGALATGLATLGVLNVVDLDARIARFNVARAEHPTASSAPLDIDYLTRLGASAAPIAVDALLADAARSPAAAGSPVLVTRCESVRRVLDRWGSKSEASTKMSGVGQWRFWNADERMALRYVSGHERELSAIEAGCPPRMPPH
jgi:Domain of unknown function (DUF4153)